MITSSFSCGPFLLDTMSKEPSKVFRCYPFQLVLAHSMKCTKDSGRGIIDLLLIPGQIVSVCLLNITNSALKALMLLL